MQRSEIEKLDQIDELSIQQTLTILSRLRSDGLLGSFESLQVMYIKRQLYVK